MGLVKVLRAWRGSRNTSTAIFGTRGDRQAEGKTPPLRVGQPLGGTSGGERGLIVKWWLEDMLDVDTRRRMTRNPICLLLSVARRGYQQISAGIPSQVFVTPEWKTEDSASEPSVPGGG